MAARSKAWVCGRSLAGTAGSNLPEARKSHVSVVCCQVRGLCVGLITCLEKCGVYESDREGPVAPWGGGRYFARLFEWLRNLIWHTSREKHRLRVLENGAPRKILGTTRGNETEGRKKKNTLSLTAGRRETSWKT